MYVLKKEKDNFQEEPNKKYFGSSNVTLKMQFSKLEFLLRNTIETEKHA